MFDPSCYEKPDMWIEMAGDSRCASPWKTEEIACETGKNLRFRGVEYLLKKNENLDRFKALIRARKNAKPVYRVTATLTGTFFAGNPKQDTQVRDLRPGYGHMGCCFLFILQETSEVESSTNTKDRDDEWKKRALSMRQKLKN
jgi:hypothetical protein